MNNLTITTMFANTAISSITDCDNITRLKSVDTFSCLYYLTNDFMTKRPSLDCALTRIMNSGVKEPFTEALKHPDSAQRFKAAKILKEIRWRPATGEETALHLAALQEWTGLPSLGAAADKILRPISGTEPW